LKKDEDGKSAHFILLPSSFDPLLSADNIKNMLPQGRRRTTAGVTHSKGLGGQRAGKGRADVVGEEILEGAIDILGATDVVVIA
jgi:hypothetical protein